MTAVVTPAAAAPVRSGTVAQGARPGQGRGVATGAGTSARSRLLSSSAETYLAIGVVAVVALLVMPLPPFLLDALLALSIALAVVVLLVTVSCRDPLEFSIFPSLLLLITLLRLGLNVSSTRLILSTGSAGQVIAAFGNFVIGGNYVVGLVIFLILVVINFTVITKGAGRIAEVAARFTLDAMPGRQMSIDADLSAGLIDEHEARRRREEISRYADFYGSMDGAAKFVRGDAVAGLIITGINLIGGFVIGMTQHGMSAGQSLSTFSALSVGDGLVTQIPALVVSTAAGMLVTYGSGGSSMAPSLAAQLTRDARAIWTASGLLALFAVVPGLPAIPFLLLSAGSAGIAYRIGTRKKAAAAAANVAEKTGEPASAASAPPVIREMLAMDPLELEIGYALLPLVDEQQGGDLLQRIGILRKQLAFEIGIIVPPARIRDNIQLGANEYVIKMRGVRVAGSEVLPRQLLALNTSGHAGKLDGIPTTDPSFGIPALWINPGQRADAEAHGYNVVEAQTVISTHLMEAIRQHAAELLSRQDTRELLDGLKESNPALVEDVVPNRLPLGTVHRVLQRLLREGIPVRDLITILEALSDAAEQTKDPEILTEHVRRALSSVIVQKLGGGQGAIRAIGMGPRLEAALIQLFGPRPRDGQRPMDSADLAAVLQSLTEMAASTRQDGRLAPLITSPALRVGVRRLLEPVLPRLPVISLAELPTHTPIHTIATWELPHAA
ncbi:MAG: flagellar biosynthesis protein FlhA [Gemmatimonadales bacterium]